MILICLKTGNGHYLGITYNPSKLKHYDLSKENPKDFESLQKWNIKFFTL